MLDGLPRGFQQQSMLRIDRGCLALGDAEERRVEGRRIVEEGAPLGHRPAGHPGLGVVVLVSVPAIAWNLGDEVVTAQQRLPELFWRVDAARKAAGHSNYSHWNNARFTHLCKPLLSVRSETAVELG